MTDITNPTEMTVVRVGSSIQPAPPGISSKPFWVEPLLASTKDGQPTAMRATLDPGVVSHWHTHPLGQVLYALSGLGVIQRAGGPITEVRPETAFGSRQTSGTGTAQTQRASSATSAFKL